MHNDQAEIRKELYEAALKIDNFLKSSNLI